MQQMWMLCSQHIQKTVFDYSLSKLGLEEKKLSMYNPINKRIRKKEN